MLFSSVGGKVIMTYGEYKKTKEYLNAEDIYLCVNGEEPIDEMYYPVELDNISIFGIGKFSDNTIQIDLIVSNWNNRYDENWIAE